MTQQQRTLAVIGAGISGLTAAYYLSRQYAVQVFEAEASLGGHTATKHVCLQGQDYWVDTGFIVFNDRTYPHFRALLAQLGVAYQPTEMGFSVQSPSGYEYAGTSLNGLFAQRKNIGSASHWRMLWDIVRFNRQCIALYEQGTLDPALTLGQYLAQGGYSRGLREHYILPMVSAIWSSSLQTAADIPLVFFIRFFYNHGLLTVTQQPQWYTVSGGSHQYLAPLTAPFADSIHTQCPVKAVRRQADGVWLTTERFGEQRFDEVVLACHSNQALSLLTDATVAEQAILGAIPYETNHVVLHHDSRVLPASKRAWASWNYQLPQQPADKAMLTYNMTMLQRLQAPEVLCVSVNPGDRIAPDKRLGEYWYSHPTFTLGSIAAQQRWADISQHHHTHFCGAYWLNGFHEDGVASALRVVKSFGVAVP